jgi:hypothetical protein
MFSQTTLAVGSFIFLIAVFIGSFLYLRRVQNKQDEQKSSEVKGALNADERRRLAQRLEREAARAERERRQEAAREASETARSNPYKEKLRLREEERLQREEREAEEAKERERELDKWKSSITKVDEGQEESARNISSIQEFFEYITQRKVVAIEDLATAFKMEVRTAAARVDDLVNQGRLFGVFDDRGRFIQVSQREIEAIQHYVSGLKCRQSVRKLCEELGSRISLGAT